MSFPIPSIILAALAGGVAYSAYRKKASAKPSKSNVYVYKLRSGPVFGVGLPTWVNRAVIVSVMDDDGFDTDAEITAQAAVVRAVAVGNPGVTFLVAPNAALFRWKHLFQNAWEAAASREERGKCDPDDGTVMAFKDFNTEAGSAQVRAAFANGPNCGEPLNRNLLHAVAALNA